MTSATRIGFIGLGIMGSPMAVHLATAGHQVTGFNRSPEKSKPLVAAGGRDAASTAEAVADADVVCLMVPDSPDVVTSWRARRVCSRMRGRRPRHRLLEHPSRRHR